MFFQDDKKQQDANSKQNKDTLNKWKKDHNNHDINKYKQYVHV